MVVAGTDLDHAMWAAVELETLAKQYYYTNRAGNMVVLAEDEMQKVLALFKDYGRQPKVD